MTTSSYQPVSQKVFYTVALMFSFFLAAFGAHFVTSLFFAVYESTLVQPKNFVLFFIVCLFLIIGYYIIYMALLALRGLQQGVAK